MAFKNRNGILATVLVVLAAAELLGGAWAATYVVGDGLGWTVPPNTTAYSNWASPHVFVVGDVLVFNFTAGFHDVAMVTNGAYTGCSSTSPIALATLGPASLTLNSTGPYYYICTFGQHCSLGQRLAINVTSSSSPPPAPAPAPAPIPPTTTPTPSVVPSPTPSVVPSPTPSSSPMPSPESAPSPTPAGSGIAPSPSSGGALSPGAAGAPGPSSGSAGDLTPPPPGSFAMKTPVFTPLAVIALLAVGLVM